MLTKTQNRFSHVMEYLEIAAPADFKTIEVEGPFEVPAVTPWP